MSSGRVHDANSAADDAQSDEIAVDTPLLEDGNMSPGAWPVGQPMVLSGWPVGGIRAHPVYEGSLSPTPETPKIVQIVSARIRTEQELAKEPSVRSDLSGGSSSGSSEKLAPSQTASFRNPASQELGPREHSIEHGQDATDVVHLENTGLSSAFATRVEATTTDGEIHTWTAREHRRNKLHDSTEITDPVTYPFTWFDLPRIKELLKNPVEAVSFSVGPIFFLGSAMFVFGCSAQEHAGYWRGEWPVPLKDWLVNIPFLYFNTKKQGLLSIQIGALLFFIGCYFAIVETANVDFEDKWHAWQHDGSIGDGPKLLFSPLAEEDGKNEFLSYYGCLIQFIGSVVFLIGASSSVLGAHDLLPEEGPFSEYVLVDVMFLLGGFCFVAGAFLLVAEGTHSWWRGCLPPFRQEEIESLPYWIGLLNWVGSLMFFGGGIQGMVSNYLTSFQEEALTSVTWLAGSVLFAIQGALLYLEMINPSWKAH